MQPGLVTTLHKIHHKRTRSGTYCGAEPIAKSKKRHPRKGDLAPPSFGLMNIANVGGMKTSFFEKSNFQFVKDALEALRAAHYDTESESVPFIAVSELLTGRCPISLPDSTRYGKLIGEMAQLGIVKKIFSFSADGGVEPPKDDDIRRLLAKLPSTIVVLPMFAVVKEVGPPGTARPIENGRSVKPPHHQALFTLPGAKQITEALCSRSTAGMIALHGDYRSRHAKNQPKFFCTTICT